MATETYSMSETWQSCELGKGRVLLICKGETANAAELVCTVRGCRFVLVNQGGKEKRKKEKKEKGDETNRYC